MLADPRQPGGVRAPLWRIPAAAAPAHACACGGNGAGLGLDRWALERAEAGVVPWSRSRLGRCWLWLWC